MGKCCFYQITFNFLPSIGLITLKRKKNYQSFNFDNILLLAVLYRQKQNNNIIFILCMQSSF